MPKPTEANLEKIMTILLFVTVVLTIFSSCKKEKYYRFSPKELDFVNYSEGQDLNYLDTNLNRRALIQVTYKRDFHERYGMLIRTREFFETYEVLYHAGTSRYAMGFSIALDKEDKTLDIDFDGYEVFANPDSLYPSVSSVSINGVSYSNVYKLKAYNRSGSAAGTYGKFLWVNGELVKNTDTATLFHNKQYGVIQLLFPNGKRVLRID